MPHVTRLAERPRSAQGDWEEFDPGRDHRFRELLSDTAWARLPAAIRNRFSMSLAGGATAVYVGAVSSVSISPAGRLLTQGVKETFDHDLPSCATGVVIPHGF